MVFNAIFNNISVLLVEEIVENHRPAASHISPFPREPVFAFAACLAEK
jgi:hypothetical protein